MQYGPEEMAEIGRQAFVDGLSEDEAVGRMPAADALADDGVDPGMAGDSVRRGWRDAAALELGKTWRGHGLLWGRDVDDSATDELHATEAEALAAVEAEWMDYLSDREQQHASVYAVQELD